jgi:HD-like signal output (HDOD) protein
VTHIATEPALLEELRTLPMRDGALVHVLEVVSDPESAAQGVADALQSDPALCARLLRLVNSPAYGLAGKVKSIDRAVIALGRSTVRALALSDSAGLFSGGAEKVPPRFWEHSAAVAVTCSLLARPARVSTADAMCAGLMHDIGAALLHQRDPSTYRTLLTNPVDLLDDERDVFGCDHAQLTRIAFAAWGLPHDLAVAISMHHTPQTGGPDRLAHLIVAAEALACDVLGESVRFGEPPSDLGVALEALGLLPTSIDPLRAQIEDEALALGAALV